MSKSSYLVSQLCSAECSWPYVVLILTTRCIYQGLSLTVQCILNCIPQHVMMTLCSTGLDHQMPLLGGMSAPSQLQLLKMSSQHYAWLYLASWPYVVLLLTTRYLYWGVGHICIVSPQNMSSWTLSNSCRLLCAVVVTVSCCCCCSSVIVHPQLQMNNNKSKQ